ncbi:hypothetical protein Q5424_27540 [Conexibacter sp. JD483]|uniref:hypothetical protein n=1 Tax=unclassified Conexibacter TaxID=2627773 RepID=UPI0027267BBF|nr:MULTISPECIES: hypothetical protein [unclassified Conexibacter]MDO8188492.1 hypothetical protein [Conexibacter sp. CPCC 205706]MDO8201432.1 hypothetical protein [Conexibacter sp. CPCC 205762]MDR9372885.1 hypothetical protein [Conexibacter sp. JD483]
MENHLARALTALLAGAALAVAGCGGNASDGATTTAAAPATTADTAPAPAATPPAATAMSPRERLRSALLVVSELPEGWTPHDAVIQYQWPHRDAHCLQPIAPPRDGAFGPFFELNPDQQAGSLVQVVERQSGTAAARRALAAFGSQRARRCFMREFTATLRASARESGIRTRLGSFRSVPLELPSVLFGDEAAGLRLCGLARFLSGRYEGRANTYCDDRVMVRAGVLTTLLHLTGGNSQEAIEADELGALAAERLEAAAAR